MEDFKESLQKLEQLLDSGVITPDESEKRKKELVDKYVLQQSASATTSAATAQYGSMEGSTIVRLRGLPFQATEADVKNFFNGFSLDPSEPIKFQTSMDGRHSGIAYVRFTDEAEATRALSKNKQYLGQRYVEVFPSNEEEFTQKTAPLATTWVRMRGIPFSATKAEIVAFFSGFDIPETSIFVVKGPGGRSTGEAFVNFQTEVEAQRAMQKDKEQMGTRYIELFLATREECDSAIARGRMDVGGWYGGDAFGAGAGAGGWYGGFPAVGYGGFGMGAMPTGGFGTDFVIRMRGLPYRSSEHDIITFFNGLSVAHTLIVYQGGRPSGEAYVEFQDQRSLDGALQRNRQLMGSRYIEVFPSSQMELQAATAQSAFEMGGYGW